MKFFRNLIVGAALALTLVAGTLTPQAEAQSYPYQTPSYTPTAVLPTSTLTATGDYYFTANGVSGASVRVSALSGSLVAAIQGSNDPTSTANASANWSTLYYLDPTAPTTAPANSITANGLYVFNTAGFTRFRVHVTTLSGGSHTVTLQAAATVGGAPIYVLNPSSAQALPAGSNTIGNVGLVAGSASVGNVGTLEFPIGATAITASATGTTGATTATLAGTSGKTTYICGFDIEANATAAATGNATITGTITGTMNFTQFTAPLASGIGSVKNNFTRCIPASAANTGIAVVSAAPGSGGTVSVSAWGYQL